jgi:hypothetical protein
LQESLAPRGASLALLPQRYWILSRRPLWLQREGTIEEIADGVKMAGAEDGLILDNGEAWLVWVWWANSYAGRIVSPTIDHRPLGTSAIVFLLRGPVCVDLPGGSVSYSVS